MGDWYSQASVPRGGRERGEPGHLLLDWQGRWCGCGRRGCAEAYVSGASIARRTLDALADDARPSSLRGLPVVTAPDVSAQAAAGDDLASDLWAETVLLIGKTVSVVVNVWEPDVLVLGGGVTRAGPR